jgi:tetratricopeptide (TPR) repeat protein
VREIAETLGASHVLEGSILQAGGQIRVNVQLIDALSGEHLWADRFDRSIDDIFAVQDEIVGTVIAELNVEFSSGEQERVYRRTTDDPEAYDLFLRALEIQGRLTMADVSRAQELFEAALVIDPTFAAATHMLAMIHYNKAMAGWSDTPEETLAVSERLFLKAIELDDSLGPAYGFLGLIYLARQEYDKALGYASRAIEITPGNAATLAYASLINTYSGAPERGLQLIQRAIQLDPSAVWFVHPLGVARIFLGAYEDAISNYRACLRDLPDFIWCNVNIIIPYLELGSMEEAETRARELLRKNPEFNTNTAVSVQRIRDPDIRAHWRDLLQQAGLP